MRNILVAAVAAFGATLSAGAALADVVDFDALPGGAAANPLLQPGATFTSVGGFNVIASGGLCTAAVAGDAADCSRDLQVDFATASSGISFNFVDNNDQTVGDTIGAVSIFAGATLLGTVNVTVLDTDPFTKDLVSLAGFSGVTRLVVTSTDFGGVVYDDFTFTGSGGGVPEPASWALMIMGFGAVGALARRRKLVPA